MQPNLPAGGSGTVQSLRPPANLAFVFSKQDRQSRLSPAKACANPMLSLVCGAVNRILAYPSATREPVIFLWWQRIAATVCHSWKYGGRARPTATAAAGPKARGATEISESAQGGCLRPADSGNELHHQILVLPAVRRTLRTALDVGMPKVGCKKAGLVGRELTPIQRPGECSDC